MNLKVKPCTLSGQINVVPSKSLAHRAILAACLSESVCVVKNVEPSNDVLATINAISALGIKHSFTNRTLVVHGSFQQLAIKKFKNYFEINCFESASTIRFFMVVAVCFGFKMRLFGSKKLIQRIKKVGAFFYFKSKQNFIEVNSIIKPGLFNFKKSLTSQFVSALILILPIFKKNSIILIEPGFESASFIKLTIAFLKQIKIKIKVFKNGFKILGNQVYKSFNYFVEIDLSNAAFFAVAGCFNQIKFVNYKINSIQPDKIILKILKKIGAKITINETDIIISSNNLVNSLQLEYFKFNLSQHIDLAPVLFILASAFVKKFVFFGSFKLLFKESNRKMALINLIKSLGGKIKHKKNKIIVYRVNPLKGGVVNCHNDHRIAMAAAIASVFCKNPIILKGAECVKKSYPKFFSDFKKLGGIVNVIDLE